MFFIGESKRGTGTFFMTGTWSRSAEVRLTARQAMVAGFYFLRLPPGPHSFQFYAVSFYKKLGRD